MSPDGGQQPDVSMRIENLGRRWLDEHQATTARAPLRERLQVARLRRVASDRKLLLLDTGVIRHAPFSPDGRTIWELLPGFRWFMNYRTKGNADTLGYDPRMTVHQAIEVVEQLADGDHATPDLRDTSDVLRYCEYAAEADRFGYDAERLIGSELRYGVAYWIERLAEVGPWLRNILDYYIAAYCGHYYAWARVEPLHPSHRAVALSLLTDIFGDPFRPVVFDPSWRSEAVVGLARGMYESRDFATMPVLADALVAAGCADAEMLGHCRGPSPHVRGCWVVDLVLGKT